MITQKLAIPVYDFRNLRTDNDQLYSIISEFYNIIKRFSSINTSIDVVTLFKTVSLFFDKFQEYPEYYKLNSNDPFYPTFNLIKLIANTSHRTSVYPISLHPLVLNYVYIFKNNDEEWLFNCWEENRPASELIYRKVLDIPYIPCPSSFNEAEMKLIIEETKKTQINLKKHEKIMKSLKMFT